MSHPQPVDVLIVGSGPAGLSTALHLAQIDAGWTERMVVVEKAVHPRPKLCGGGVTRPGEAVLARLGLPFEPPHVPVREVRFVYGQQVYALHAEPAFRVTRREVFDHWLVEQAQARGVAVRQGEAVRGITLQPDGVEVVTEKTVFRAQVVVAADGSRSFVRRALKWPAGAHPPLARLLEVLTPEAESPRPDDPFARGVAVFDFTPMASGVQGYTWDFPSLVGGRRMMNRGIFDSRIRAERPRAPLKAALAKALARQGRQLAAYPLQGHPIRWFDPAGVFAMPRVLLAGDAAGVDPFVGEGIAFALGYGGVAAAAIADAFARRDFRFADYRTRLLRDPIVSPLAGRTALAKFLYRLRSPRWIALGWRLAPLIVRLLAWFRPAVMPFPSPRLHKVR
ncbi:MAG: hypothetical protein D6796_09455 [Caldilineae bacterium]|nr:MAG: hypothetical protein D6796_09455 [Caldilineae bacterium]